VYTFDAELRRSGGFVDPVEATSTAMVNLPGTPGTVPFPVVHLDFPDISVDAGPEVFTLRFVNVSGPGTMFIEVAGIGNFPCTDVVVTNENNVAAPTDRTSPTGFRLLAAELSASESCSGDGGDQMGCTSCPCGNDAVPGTIGGCLNSAGSSTRLLASGSDSITAADLRFEASGAPPLNSAVLTSGNALAPANMANPCFGMSSGVQSVNLDGLRCAVQSVLRHGVRPSDANGDIGATTNGWGTPSGFFNFAAFVAGDTKHFQIIHRDTTLLVCLTGQNTSQALSVTFAP
jgi:hypothetical protein